MKITLQVNASRHTIEAPPMKRLLDVLREDLKLTGTKEGCGEGECGACSMIIDGEVINSCLVPVCQVMARASPPSRVASDGRLSSCNRPFSNAGGPVRHLHARHADRLLRVLATSIAIRRVIEIKVAIAGNLCRCTGYVKIIDAIEIAA